MHLRKGRRRLKLFCEQGYQCVVVIFLQSEETRVPLCYTHTYVVVDVLAICNEFMIDKIQNMKIDEDELFRPTNYKGTKTTKT